MSEQTYCPECGGIGDIQQLDGEYYACSLCGGTGTINAARRAYDRNQPPCLRHMLAAIAASWAALGLLWWMLS